MSGLPRVAVVGLGAMGSRLAANLLADGHAVTVFSRTAQRAGPLQVAGARVAASAREAAAQADVVLVAVTDDRASHDVWLHPDHGLLPALAPAALAVEASTLSPSWVRQLARAAREGGVRFLEAPMIGSRPQAEARALVHLVGGAAADLAVAEPVLAVSATEVHHTGEAGSAATLKLIVNALLATQLATLAELLAVARRAGLDPAASVELLSGLPVTSPAAARAAGLMLAEHSPPNFPVRLVTKDLRYLVELAAEQEGSAPMSASALAAYTALAEQGYGEQDLTAIARSAG